MQQLLLALNSHIPIGLVILAQDRTVRYVNTYMATQAAISSEEVIGRHFVAAFSVTHADKLACSSGLCSVCVGEAPRLDDAFAPIEINVKTACGRTKQLHSLMCFPFTYEATDDHYAVLFYDPDADESSGFHNGLSRAIHDIREVRNEQQRLIAEIKRGNAKLILSEKMAVIGQMAAGVAHEINNPVGYIFSNLKTLADYVTDLLKIIDAVDKLQSIEEIRQLKCTLDYAYMRGDIEALITESGEGISRVKGIISALQDFCHTDDEVFSRVDLHRSLDSTLNVATNEIKYKALLVKEYGNLPAIECNASQISQVALNLLLNAAQAIEHEGTITVRTGREADEAWFEVEDTGKGIEPDNVPRVFEPFFTTKGVGQGTGLGLALSHNIIQKHRGRIEVFSEVGKGTRMRVWLPVTQPPSRELTE